MKKFLMMIVAVCMMAMITTLLACSSTTTTANKTTTEKPTTTQKAEDSTTNTDELTTINDVSTTVDGFTPATFIIKVYDIDGEELGNKTLTTSEETYTTVWGALQAEFDVVSYDSTYGPSISSINGSIVDSNWYLAIYENGELASTGVAGLELNDGDVFEFKSECWNTKESGYGALDSYDVLVDKIIYSYAKGNMQQALTAVESYNGSEFWTFMTMSMMANAGYDSNLFGTKNVNPLVSESIEAVTDFSSFSGAQWGKYYYTARALNMNLDAFKTAYENHINETIVNEYAEYGEYTLPFEMSPAKALNFTSSRLSALVNTEYHAGTSFGIDGFAWQVTSLQLWEKYTEEVLQEFPLEDQGNGTSCALELLVYAAFNKPVRGETSDLIKTIIDTYYDETLGLVKNATTDTEAAYSTNQIYAGLMAYKVCRDKAQAVNIFA